MLDNIIVSAAITHRLWSKRAVAISGFAAILNSFLFVEAGTANLSTNTTASATSTIMKGIQDAWQDCEVCRRFFGEETFNAGFKDPMNTPRY